MRPSMGTRDGRRNRLPWLNYFPASTIASCFLALLALLLCFFSRSYYWKRETFQIKYHQLEINPNDLDAMIPKHFHRKRQKTIKEEEQHKSVASKTSRRHDHNLRQRFMGDDCGPLGCDEVELFHARQGLMSMGGLSGGTFGDVVTSSTINLGPAGSSSAPAIDQAQLISPSLSENQNVGELSSLNMIKDAATSIPTMKLTTAPNSEKKATPTQILPPETTGEVYFPSDLSLEYLMYLGENRSSIAQSPVPLLGSGLNTTDELSLSSAPVNLALPQRKDDDVSSETRDSRKDKPAVPPTTTMREISTSAPFIGLEVTSPSLGDTTEQFGRTVDPSLEPTHFITMGPTFSRSIIPSKLPSQDPSVEQTSSPTRAITLIPTSSQSVQPTKSPTLVPSFIPSVKTSEPSLPPTNSVSVMPTSLSMIPTKLPSSGPSVEQTSSQTRAMTTIPTSSPSRQPTKPSMVVMPFTQGAKTDEPSLSPTHTVSIVAASPPSVTPTSSLRPSLPSTAQISIRTEPEITTRTTVIPSMSLVASVEAPTAVAATLPSLSPSSKARISLEPTVTLGTRITPPDAAEEVIAATIPSSATFSSPHPTSKVFAIDAHHAIPTSTVGPTADSNGMLGPPALCVDPSNRTSTLISSLTQLFRKSDFSAKSSPQALAMDWIVHKDEFFRMKPCQGEKEFKQRYVLGVFYFQLEGTEWIENEKWLGETHECKWAGVLCNQTGQVVALRLADNNLKGSIPHEIGELSSLTALELYSNRLSGKIPKSFGSLSNIVLMDLFDNELNGMIPNEVFDNMISLEYLRLSKNSLGGVLSRRVGSLTNLRELWIAENEIDGEFPKDIGSLTNLESIILYDNNITGTLPPSIGNLENLKHLDLMDNQMHGEIPLDIYSLDFMRYLYLAFNSFTGVLSTRIGQLTNLQELRIEHNMLSGIFPVDVTTLRFLEILSAGANKFTGSFPASMASMHALTWLDVSDNDMSGHIPNDLFSLDTLAVLYLSNNRFNGTIPRNISNLNNLVDLYLDGNAFTGNLAGINGGELPRLEEILLNGNNLTGEIPESLCALRTSGMLDNLWADCASGKIRCTCCTYCED